ncbi:MAG: stage IV sporulation protein A [Clostridia bacterium]|nr:stage IV sporulation protein A [Clostridia bacterium]
MTSTDIYRDISQRTGGDIYIGVVGPVRTGKSTFIKKFCETLILPHVPADFSRERMTDELPQSSAGRTIMTTEPKFIPEKGARITLEQNAEMNVRLVDCVGYIVPSSLGYIEDDAPRMVKTPWFEEEIPFNMAAEIGTKKVINEHSTIGLVITTDGSISEIPREEYEEAEERVITELKEINKPFVTLLNCVYPESAAAMNLAARLTEKYGVPVLPVNCLRLTEEEIRRILSEVLFEFPLKRITVAFPGWVCGLAQDSPVRAALLDAVRSAAADVAKLRQLEDFTAALTASPEIASAGPDQILFGSGDAMLSAQLDDSLFYGVISSIAGKEVADDVSLIGLLEELAEVKKKYARIERALEEVNTTGYGIVMPTIEEMTLEEPEIVRQGSKYGVRLKAGAPSIHLLRADIKTEVAPVVGSEKQSEELVKYLLDGFEEDPSKIWESNIFGKSLDDLVNEGLKAKLTHMPFEARQKLQQTLEKVINEGCSGLICIII